MPQVDCDLSATGASSRDSTSSPPSDAGTPRLAVAKLPLRESRHRASSRVLQRALSYRGRTTPRCSAQAPLRARCRFVVHRELALDASATTAGR